MIEPWKPPPPVTGGARPASGWKRRWPVLTLFSAVGVVLLAAAIGWTYYEDLRRFPPDRADPDALALPLPAEPSAVVLPFAAASGRERDVLLADRMAADLTDALARVPGLFLIAPETATRLRGGRFRIAATAEGLGVRYLVAASLDRKGKGYRVFAQVIDAFSGEPDWAEGYDIPADGLPGLRDPILAAVLETLDVDFDPARLAEAAGAGPSGPAAWFALVEAEALRVPDDRESMAAALARLERARAADPGWAAPPLEIARVHLNAARRGWTGAPWSGPGGPGGETADGPVERGLAAAAAARALDPGNPAAAALAADLLALSGDAAAAALERRREAVRLGPNGFAARWALAEALAGAGRPGEAVAAMARALRLHPRRPAALDLRLAELRHLAGEDDAALAALDRAIERRPAAREPRLMRILVHAARGDRAAAEAGVAALLRLYPEFRFSEWSAARARRGRPDRAGWRDALAAAGVPD